jgi:hypothetical protein
MIDVSIYVDNVQVGSGNLSYIDTADWGLLPVTESRCTYTDICFDNLCYSNAVTLCYEDKVTDWLPGSRQVQLSAPVYIDDEVAGEAQLTYTDTYGMSILVLITLLILALYFGSRLGRR